MEFKCICGKVLEVDKEDNIIPDHDDPDGGPCPASGQSTEDDMYQDDEVNSCPLKLDISHCADCAGQPCLNGDDDED